MKKRKSFVNTNLPSRIFRRLHDILRGEKQPIVNYKKVRGLDQREN